jgi:hypothetical protein
MPLKDVGMIGGPMSGPPPDFVICAPVPVPASGVMTCRSGQDGRTFQGEKMPMCDGTLRPKAVGAQLFFSCDKCSLSHQVAVKDGIEIYGALL